MESYNTFIKIQKHYIAEKALNYVDTQIHRQASAAPQ